jgi:tetratricopeptide (TPR) repeat protein
LNLLGTYLRDAHGGDIRQGDLIKLEEADAEEQGGHAFRVMDAYVQSFESGGKTAEEQAKGGRALALLQLLGLFDRPATADLLEALWDGEPIAGLTEPLIGISEAQRNLSLKRLEDAKLLTATRVEGSGTLIALDAHPLLREYFARRVRQKQPEAWRAAHRRLYEHLCANTDEGDEPTLEDLQPLYQAVAHSCQAGLQQEALDDVCYPRIWRGDEMYMVRKFGAFASDLGAIACFFELPWGRIGPLAREADKAFILNCAAYCLRALGRLTESLEPLRAGLEWLVRQEDWGNAATAARELSMLYSSLGDVESAVRDAEKSAVYADRSGGVFERMAGRCSHAYALYQAGRRAEAEGRFREAEQIQAEGQPAYPLLYSVRGFKYCDLLLTKAERGAWQMGYAEGGTLNAELMEACRTVSERAAQTLKWEEGMRGAPILDFALHHLTLGRAALYAAILRSAVSEFRIPNSELDLAVSGLRKAGEQRNFPRRSSPAPGCGVALALAPVQPARRATWTKPGKSPSADR